MQNGIYEVGDTRTFTAYGNQQFVIVEVLEDPGMSMTWNWDDSICPHCKYKITHVIDHVFSRIEILAKVGVKNITRDDLVFLGDTTDKRRLFLTIEKINEALAKSKLFANLLEGSK